MAEHTHLDMHQWCAAAAQCNQDKRVRHVRTELPHARGMLVVVSMAMFHAWAPLFNALLAARLIQACITSIASLQCCMHMSRAYVTYSIPWGLVRSTSDGAYMPCCCIVEDRE